MAIPFDTDWRRVATSPDAAVALARWATAEPSLAGADLDAVRQRAAGPDVAQSDATLKALLRLARADLLARRVILEALMARLIPIAAALARRNGDPYDDVLAELAGWAWELAATIPANPSAAMVAPNLARMAKRRYLAARPYNPAVGPLDDTDPPERTDRLDEQLGAIEVRALLDRAVASQVIPAAAAQVLHIMAVADATNEVIAGLVGRSEAATQKARARAEAQLRICPWALGLRAA